LSKRLLKGEELFEISSDYCFLIDKLGNIFEVNRAAINGLGYTKIDILKKNLTDLFADGYPSTFIKALESSVKKISTENIECEFKTKSDDSLNISLSISVLKNKQDDEPLIYINARDITEQRRAQKQLLRFANALHYTVNPTEITDPDGKLIYVNPAFEKVTGYSKQELIAKDPNILSSGKHPKEFWNKMWETIEAGKVWTGEIENKHKDGHPLYEHLIISPIIDPSGKIIGYLGTHQDLTEQRRLETELHERQLYLATILQDSADAIIGLDLENRIYSWNKGAEKIYGYTEKEVLGKNFSVLVPKELVHSGELEKIDQIVKQKGYISNYETERLTKDGKRISIQLTRTLIKDSKGNIIGTSAIVRDVTEIKRLKRQISHAEKLSVVGQLAAGIAHEVGNPLTSISSLVQIIQMTTNDNFAKEKLELVKNQINRIAKTIRELVDFSRPSNYEVKLTDLNKVIQDALNIVRYGKKSKDINFVLELDSSLPRITLVQDQIIQVFINLLLNAVDAMEGKPGEIKILSRLNNQNIQVMVIDKGKGISDDIKNKIFEPFFTTKKVGEGTGLGLWVSYGIVKNFGGEIDVESEVGAGSTFIVTLPTKLI
jgi:PAS domain S-box-containing protein